MDPTSSRRQIATLGGGCFWCLEAVYQDLKGVDRVVSGYISGYMGGHVDKPSYQQVCSGTTGHAEVVHVGFDPEAVSYRELLGVFFSIHDPTTVDRQGADVGPQYRSVIFTHDERQHREATEMIDQVAKAGIWRDTIATEVTPADTFYEAELYHQNYYRNHPDQGYCRVVIAPKVATFRKHYLEMLQT